MAHLKASILMTLVVMSALSSISECAKKPAASVARKEDIPFIKCQVCEKLAAQLHSQVEKKRAEIQPKKILEYQIIEITENVCNLKKAEADWMLLIDIVENGDELKLVEQESEGQCNSECKTIERACQEVLGYFDTDVAEYLYKSKPDMGSFVKYLCKDLTTACSIKPPPVPKDRTPGEVFEPKSEKETEMERIMKSMEGMPGAPGMKMYSREELMKKNFGVGDGDEEDDDDDEEDDEHTQFPSKLGKALRDKESKKSDLKHKISDGIEKTKDTLKTHANKASNWLLQKWRGLKEAAMEKSKKPSKAEL